MSSRARNQALIARACVHCRKRKSRCSGSAAEGEACTYCARTGKVCSFEEPADRTPLKRKNLDAAEQRIAQLQALLRAQNPGLDIDAALADLRPDPPAADARAAGSPLQEAERTDSSSADAEKAGYEWHEAPSDSPLDRWRPGQDSPHQGGGGGGPKDGMAVFSSTDSGYLGSSSGSSLLADIAAQFPLFAVSQHMAAAQRQQASSAGEQPDPPGLADSAIVDLLIDAYFLFYNTSYPIIHEKTFREKAASNWQQRESRSTWSIIYYMVLAVGQWVSSPQTDDGGGGGRGPPKAQAQSPYYLAARSRLSFTMLESGTLESLQAFLLMGNYLQKTDRPNTGYNLIGVAYRSALGLGLHREVPHGAADNLLHEQRRRLFWTVYCFDSGFNITTGRPPTVGEAFFDIGLPRNAEDDHCTANAHLPRPVGHPTQSSALIAQSQLARLATAVYSEFLMAKTANTKIEYQIADSMEQGIGAWRAALPAYFTQGGVPGWFLGPRSVVLWKSQNLRILLWRGTKQWHPFLAHRPCSESRCLEIAMQSIHDIAAFCSEFESLLHVGLNWYATYFLFQAALMLEGSYLKDTQSDNPVGDRLSWKLSISEAIGCLEILAKKNQPARRCLDVLGSIESHFLAQEDQHIQAQQPPPPPPNLPNPPRNPPIGAAAPPSAEGGFQMQPGLMPDFGGGGQDLDMGGDGWGLNDFVNDPTLRLLVDQTPLDFLADAPRDFLFGNDKG